MVRREQERVLTRFATRFGVLVVAAALPLGLLGCGVKGPLDPPPGAKAAAVAPVATEPAPEAWPGITPPKPAQVPGLASSAVAKAPAARERHPLDWLLD